MLYFRMLPFWVIFIYFVSFIDNSYKFVGVNLRQSDAKFPSFGTLNKQVLKIEILG